MMIKCLSETSEIIIISAIISQQVTHSGHEHYVIIILNVFWISTTGQNSSWLPALRHFPIMLRCNPLEWLCMNNSENCTVLGISKPHTEIQYELHRVGASVLYLLWDTPEKYSFSELHAQYHGCEPQCISLLFCSLGSLHVIIYACLYLAVLTIN